MDQVHFAHFKKNFSPIIPGPGDSGINQDRAALGASNWKEQAAFQGRTYGMVISHNHPISCNFAFGTQGLDPYPGFNASE